MFSVDLRTPDDSVHWPLRRNEAVIDWSRLPAAPLFSHKNNYKLFFYEYPLDMKQSAVLIFISFI
jgi:hypothetical protein